MTKRPIEIDLSSDDVEPVSRIHTCTVCGTTGSWGPEWSWYGSWRELDNNPDKVVKCCSVVCRRQHAADNGIDSGLVDR